MKRMTTWLIGVLAGLAASSAALAGPGGLEVAISSDRTTITANEDLVIHVSITNISGHPVKLLKWSTPADEVEGALFSVAVDGASVPYLGAHYKRPAPTAADFLKLAPGESLDRDMELTALYDMTVTGNYTIQFDVAGWDLFALKPRGNSAGTRLDLDRLTSNVLSIYVQGHPSQLESLVSPLAAAATTSSISFTGSCSNTQKSALTTAHGNALNYATNSVSYLNAGTTGSRYKTWFGTVTSSRYSTVRSHFVAIEDAFATKAVSYDCGCKGNYYAYVYSNKPYQIHLCKVFWTAPATGTDSKAGTLVHEMSHFDVVAGTEDWAYGKTDAKNLAISNPTRAVDNADNHEYFGENTPIKY